MAWLEPYGVAAFTRTDAALAAGGERAAGGIGWSALGRGPWGGHALAVGTSVAAAPDRLQVGGSFRRSTRGEAHAWSADLGIWCHPAREWRTGFAARSLWRGGRPSLSPEPEWEAAVVWAPEPLALGVSIVRDAVGPIENRLGARLAMGPLETLLAYSDRVGDESRLIFGLSLRALGWRFGAARETGRTLPDSKGGFLERVPARRESAGVEAAGRKSAARAPAHLGRDRRMTLSWGVTIGQTAGPAAGWGLRGGGIASARGPRGGGLELLAAASRDPGERAGLDESRLTLRLFAARRAEVLLGSFDLRAGRGLVLSAASAGSEGSDDLVAAVPAGDWRRSPVPSLVGGAARWGERTRLHLAWGRAARDARPVGSALWPSGGRLHRTPLELERRGRLEEELWSAAAERRVTSRTRVAVGGATARYRAAGGSSSAPRLVPGGATAGRRSWAYLALTSESRRGRQSVEVACDGAGRLAAALWLRGATAAEKPRGRLELLAERHPAGFAGAAAWPSLGRLTRLAARAELSPLAAPWTLALTRGFEERWLPPTATLPARHEWVEEGRLSLRRSWGSGSAGLEAGHRDTRRDAAPSSAASGFWLPSARTWLDAEWSFHATSTLRLWLSPRWSRSSSGWREQWALGVAGRGAVAWEIESFVRPGGAVDGEPESFEGNPLGGYRLLTSTSPTRFRLRAARGRVDGEVRWTQSAGRPRPEVWLTVQSSGRPRMR